LLPQEPRLFCLLYNGVAVDYESSNLSDSTVTSSGGVIGGGDTGEQNESLNCSERESIIFKEIHSFTQQSLDDRGVFLLDFSSEAFIWLGKKVSSDKDRNQIYQLAFNHLAALHHQSK
jgi:hypothetical protein